MFAKIVRTQKYSASALPEGYEKPYYPLIVMNDDYSVVDNDVHLRIYTDRGDINLILGFQSGFESDEYTGTVIDVTLKPDNLVLINAQPVIYVDTDLSSTFTLNVEVTYKGEKRTLSQQVETLQRLDISTKCGDITVSPRFHLEYAYGAGNKQSLTYIQKGDNWGDKVNIIIAADNDAVLKDSGGNIVSQIILNAEKEPYEYNFSCVASKKGVSVLSVSLDGDIPEAEKGIIYSVPWILSDRKN